jgi:nucleoside 2-deoxyribosyltransferase
MRELRSALRDPPTANPLGYEIAKMQHVVKQATVANRALKAAWHEVRHASETRDSDRPQL